MRKLLIVAGAFLIGLAPAAVSAKLFDYSISFAQSNDLSTIYRAAGRLDATLVGAWGPGNVNELFQVNSASGFVTNNYNSNSATIDGVEPFSGSYPQFTFFKGSFDNAGLALTTLDGGSFYVFNSGGGPSAAYVEAFGNAYGSITAVVVPEPAAWAMMLIGFGFAGAALRARRAGPSAVRA